MADTQHAEQAQPQSQMHRADFVASIVLLAFGIMIVVLSVQMPRLEHRNINPYTVPGLVPGLLGAAITAMSVMMLVRSLLHKGYALGLTRARIAELLSVPQLRRVLVTLIFCLFYAVGIVGRLWYPAATFIFVFGFILLFEYRRDHPLRRQKARVAFAGVEALLTAAVVSAVFRYLFLVRLP